MKKGVVSYKSLVELMLNTHYSVLSTKNIQPLKIKLQPWKMTKS